MSDPIALFFIFLKAAALGMGGYGSLPLLREDLVLTGLATDEQLIQSLAVGRFSTGPNGTYVVSLGYFAGGIGGAAAALVASCLPPLLMVPLVALVRGRLLSPGFAGFTRGVLLAISGLLLAFGVAILAPAGPSGLAWWHVILALGAMAVTVQGRLHPALLIGLGAAAGLVLGR